MTKISNSLAFTMAHEVASRLHKKNDVVLKSFKQKLLTSAKMKKYLKLREEEARIEDDMAMLKKEDVEFLGQDFKQATEFLEKVRKFNFNSTEEYLKFVGYDEKSIKERFEKLAVEVSRHELPEAGEEALIMGGGQDKANSANDIVGGFGDPEYKKKK